MKKQLFLCLAETMMLLIAAGLSFLMHLWPGDAAVVLSVFFSHVLYPALSFLVPLWAAKRGSAAFFCALIPFCIYLPLWLAAGLNPPALPCILTLLLAVIGACTGDEIRKRSGRRHP